MSQCRLVLSFVVGQIRCSGPSILHAFLPIPPSPRYDRTPLRRPQHERFSSRRQVRSVRDRPFRAQVTDLGVRRMGATTLQAGQTHGCRVRHNHLREGRTFADPLPRPIRDQEFLKEPSPAPSPANKSRARAQNEPEETKSASNAAYARSLSPRAPSPCHPALSNQRPQTPRS